LLLRFIVTYIIACLTLLDDYFSDTGTVGPVKDTLIEENSFEGALAE